MTLQLTDRDVAIYSQVAAKMAFGRVDPSFDVTDSEALENLKVDAVALYEFLVDLIDTNVTANRATQATQVSAAVRDAFPGTTVAADGTAEAPHPAEQGGFSLEIANPNEQQGPIPAWAIAAAQKQGIRKVWDNRGTATGNQPHFKEVVPKGQNARGIWPPKAR